MGQCMSTTANPYGVQEPAGHTKPAKQASQTKRHDHGADISLRSRKSIIEGLAGAYKVLKLLGSGAEGNTFLVQDVADSRKWAIKLIKLPLPTRYVQSIYREIKLQSELGEGHKNIITTQEVVLTSHYLGLVMEFAAGGALTSLLSKRFREKRGAPGLLMPEDEARYLFRQIVNAVDYCHRHKVAHRDLKLDNTLITTDSPPIIKVCDFGFARGWGESSHFTTVIGTPDYMSPQITAGKANAKVKGPDPSPTGYDGSKADVWAMGVLLCVMLLGKFPYEGGPVSDMEGGLSQVSHDLLTQIWVQQNRRAWHSDPQIKEQLSDMSGEVQDLLDKMFQIEEKNRIDVASIKAHPWFSVPMRPEFEEASARLEREQQETERRIAAGAYTSKKRDQAINELIKLAASEEFKRRATEPITAHTTFQIWSRIGLRTELDHYNVLTKKTLQQLIAESDKLSTRFAQSRSMLETAMDPSAGPPRTSGPHTLVLDDGRSSKPRGVKNESNKTGQPLPEPSNQPTRAIFKPRPDLGFRSMMHGSGGENLTLNELKKRNSHDGSGLRAAGSDPLDTQTIKLSK